MFRIQCSFGQSPTAGFFACRAPDSFDNAIYAVSGTGRIDIRTRRDGEFFLVEIADNGSGIPPEARQHIFAVPFFTTKGSGTGLGLVISHRIVVERHNGKIDFSTEPDGTQFNVRLPFESPAHA